MTPKRLRQGKQIASATRSHTNLYETSSNSSTSSSPSPSNSPPRSNEMIKYHKTVTSTPYRMISEAPVSFENMIKETEKLSDGSENETIEELCVDINDIPEGDIKKLQPILWLELATIFDKNHIALDRRKPFKRKRKEEGNVFGVSLNALVRRDQQITEEDTTLVPLILQCILRELTDRGAKEEGILRVAGHKQKVHIQLFRDIKNCLIDKLYLLQTEHIYQEVEQNFYIKTEKVESSLNRTGVHDLSALLKRWLRELPQPILANDLVHLFYQTHG